jgi:predicted 3-demethylubiquinone-9 3-methyltransferase (glyoxalase superfamily)
MAIIQKIVPNLWFDGNAKEAVDFYTGVFKDGKTNLTTYYPTEGLADFQQPLAGKELTINFELGGQQFTAINAGPEFKFNESVSFLVNCADQIEIDYFWEKLSAMPEAEQCGWCKDKYGLSWQIVPADMDELMSSSDGSANTDAFAAMMQMKKIVIAELENAGGKE